MGVSRRAAAAFAVVALIMIAPATAPAARSEAADLPSIAEALERLTDRGVDKADIVVQQGPRNYAGADCPGAGWECTTSKAVVQHSTVAVVNIAECSPDGTTSDTSCSIVQVSAGGTNDARCEITDNESSSATTCTIDQTNTTGPNSAETVQVVTQTSSSLNVFQDAEVQSSVTQDNQSGSNSSSVTQTVTQSAALSGPFAADHNQDARFCASVHQTSTSGPNDSTIGQTHQATTDVTNVISLQQRQQAAALTQQPCADGGLTDPSDFPNIHAVATQFSQTGDITQAVGQTQTLDQAALSVLGPTTQLQGPEVAFSGGGLAVELDGDTQSDTSNYTVSLDKDWSQDATSVEAISQTQNDKEALSGIGLGFGGRSYRDCTWLLDTSLTATQTTLPIFESDPTQTSSQRATTHCTRSTDGTISSNLNGQASSQQFDDEFVNEEVNRGPGAPESGPAAYPHLHKAVANDSRSEPFGVGPESPTTTDAFPGERIAFKLTAHNHGAEGTTATGVSVSDVVPDMMTFVPAASSPACSASGSGGAGDVVTCSLPDLTGGGSSAVTLMFDLDEAGYEFDQTIPNTASLATDGAPDVPSNSVSVTVLDPPVELRLRKAVRNDSTGGSFSGPATPSSAEAFPGHFIRYRLTAENDGHPAGTATGVTITEVVPQNMTAHACTSPCAITGLGGPGETVTWILPDMPGGTVVTRDVVFRLDPDASDYASFPAAIDNTATMQAAGQEPVTSNSTTVTVQEPFPISGLQKAAREVNCGEGCFFGTFASEVTAEAGQGAEYRMRYTNTGPGPATNVVIHDQVPGHMSFHSCPALPVPCTSTIGGSAPAPGAPAGSNLYWELGTVAAGATVDVTFRVDLNDDCDPGWTGSGDFVDNIATADSAEELPVSSEIARVNVDVFCFTP